MFWRALIAFLACPGMVAYLVPLVFLPTRAAVAPAGLVAVVLGTVLLLWCIRDFYVIGKGTLAPWAPPQRLVEVGLYRFTRNPMYVAVSIVLLGWAWIFLSAAALAYACAVMLAFHLRVIFGEEPWLARTHGEEWTRYAARVPRWLVGQSSFRRKRPAASELAE